MQAYVMRPKKKQLYYYLTKIISLFVYKNKNSDKIGYIEKCDHFQRSVEAGLDWCMRFGMATLVPLGARGAKIKAKVNPVQ